MQLYYQRLIATALSVSMLLQGCASATLNMDGNVAPTAISTHVEDGNLPIEARAAEEPNDQNTAKEVFVEEGVESSAGAVAQLQLATTSITNSTNDAMSSPMLPRKNFLAAGSYYRAMHLNHPFFHSGDLIATTIAYMDCELVQATLTHVGNVSTLISIQATCACALCKPANVYEFAAAINASREQNVLKAWHQDKAEYHALFATTDITALLASYLECEMHKALFEEFNFLCILTGKECNCVELCKRPAPVYSPSSYSTYTSQPRRKKNGAYTNRDDAQERVQRARSRHGGGHGTEALRVYYDKQSKGWRIDNPRRAQY